MSSLKFTLSFFESFASTYILFFFPYLQYLQILINSSYMCVWQGNVQISRNYHIVCLLLLDNICCILHFNFFLLLRFLLSFPSLFFSHTHTHTNTTHHTNAYMLDEKKNSFQFICKQPQTENFSFFVVVVPLFVYAYVLH